MKEILKRKFERWRGESWFGLLLWVAIAGALSFLFMVTTADRQPRCYYLGSYGTGAGIAYQIKIDINYTEDPTAFSSSDYKVVMEVFDTLPQCGN